MKSQIQLFYKQNEILKFDKELIKSKILDELQPAFFSIFTSLSKYVSSLSSINNENFVKPLLVLNGTIQQTFSYLKLIPFIKKIRGNRNEELLDKYITLISKYVILNIFCLDDITKKIEEYYEKSQQENTISEDLQQLFDVYTKSKTENLDYYRELCKKVFEHNKSNCVAINPLDAGDLSCIFDQCSNEENNNSFDHDVDQENSVYIDDSHEDVAEGFDNFSGEIKECDDVTRDETESEPSAEKVALTKFLQSICDDCRIEIEPNFCSQHIENIDCYKLSDKQNQILLGYIFFKFVSSEELNGIVYEISYKTKYCLPMTLINLSSSSEIERFDTNTLEQIIKCIKNVVKTLVPVDISESVSLQLS